MKLVKDLYVITTEQEQYILYAPLKRIALLVNADAVSTIDYIRARSDLGEMAGMGQALQDFIGFLERSRLLDVQDDILPAQPDIEFLPTSVILLPTFDCDLRCVYCYAASGDYSRSRMSWDVAKAAIDLVVENASNSGSNTVQVAFHGGGEPTLAWSLLTKCVDYAKELARCRDLRLRTSLATNGVLNATQRKWIIDNLDSVQVSLDGPPSIQNFQRPLVNGHGSFQYVLDTIRFFQDHQFDFAIQTVITDTTATRMIDLVDFFASITAKRLLHFEPLFECGRCVHSGWKEPDPDVFAEEYVRAWKYAASLSIELNCSVARLTELGSTFCGASGHNFIVTPEGNITACLEVSNWDDARADVFIYGRYDSESKRFLIAQDKLRFLASRNIHNMPSCSDCPFKWHCSGDCLAKSLLRGSLFDPTKTQRCHMARSISTEQLLSALVEPELCRKANIPVFDIT